MRKRSLFIALMIMLLCAGCSTNTTYNIEQIYATDKEYPAQPYWGYECNIKKTEDGYYYADGAHLYFFSPDTKQGGIVCSAANCDHNGEYCNGCLGSFGNGMEFTPFGLEVYNNQLYKIVYNLSEITDYHVYSISLDGSKRTKLGYLYSQEEDAQGGITWWYDWIMVDGYYYGPLNFEEGSPGLYKIRLDGEKTLVYDLSDRKKAGIHRLKGVGEFIYFEEYWRLDETDISYISNLSRYNTKTGETEVMYEGSMPGDYCVVDNDTIFCHNVKNKCFFLDLNTGEETYVLEKFESIYAVSFDGKYVYVDDGGIIYVYDLQGNLVDKIVYGAGTNLFGDEEYLFIESWFTPETDEYETYKKQDGVSDGNSVSLPSEDKYLWILDKSQLGQDNKEWMKMELE